VFALFVALLLNAAFTFAQEQPAAFGAKGQVELGGSGSFQSFTPVYDGKTGSTTSFITINPFVGVFILDGLEIGVNPLGLTVMTSGGGASTGLLALGSIAYHPPSTAFAHPFIEGLVGYSLQTNGTTYSGVTWGGRGGIKLSITGKGLLNLGVQYLQVTLNREGAKERNGSNQLSISVGYTVWL
jgi:hypothetical protein